MTTATMTPKSLTDAHREYPDWRSRAACVDNPALFFPDDGTSPVAKARQIERAKAVCRTCPVISECLAYALRTGEDNGVWGGLDADELFKLRNGRDRASVEKARQLKEARKQARALNAKGTLFEATA